MFMKRTSRNAIRYIPYCTAKLKDRSALLGRVGNANAKKYHKVLYWSDCNIS